MHALTVGSLFAGIGGFDLGFERAGFEIRWQVELDPWCRAVLATHWPDVRRYDDVRDVHGEAAHMADAACQYSGAVGADVSGDGERRVTCAAGERWARRSRGRNRTGHATDNAGCPACLAPVDVICGGFPCQPHSLAGRRAGADDDRDLWLDFVRLIRECEPRWVVAENVPGLLSSDAGRFFGTILGDLAACGYDAEWDCLPASAFGAPHRRDRVWIVAYPNIARLQGWNGGVLHQCSAQRLIRSCRPLADTDDESQSGCAVHDEAGSSLSEFTGSDEWWRIEPDVGRVAHGVPARVDRLRGLGNAIVPQIAEWLARRILDAESVTHADTR